MEPGRQYFNRHSLQLRNRVESPTDFSMAASFVIHRLSGSEILNDKVCLSCRDTHGKRDEIASERQSLGRNRV